MQHMQETLNLKLARYKGEISNLKANGNYIARFDSKAAGAIPPMKLQPD